jgi:hypothetical protein
MVEQGPFGGDIVKRLGPLKPLDRERLYRKIVVQGVSTKRDNPFIA